MEEKGRKSRLSSAIHTTFFRHASQLNIDSKDWEYLDRSRPLNIVVEGYNGSITGVYSEVEKLGFRQGVRFVVETLGFFVRTCTRNKRTKKRSMSHFIHINQTNETSNTYLGRLLYTTYTNTVPNTARLPHNAFS